jgi:FkbM family methyltransferase
MRSFHLDGQQKAGVLGHFGGALANYRRLARYNRFLASFKYLYFEMIGRKKLVQVQYAGHRIFVRTCSPDMIVAHWCLEGAEFKILKELLGNVKAIIDGGSYVGLSALALANIFPESRIFAIEPDPENYDLLVRNTADMPNIIAINAALMAESGGVTLFDPGNGQWGFSTISEVGGAKRAEIPGLSVADVMRKFKLDHVDVLKLDVEGAEKAILENSNDWIDSAAVIYAELHERFVPGTIRAFFRATEGFEDVPTKGEKVCAINRKLVERLAGRDSA